VIATALYFWRQKQRPTNPATQKASLRLLWLDQAQFAGFYAAKARGFYAREGLDVTLNPGGTDINPTQLVASGVDAFGVASGPDILAARSHGVPVVALAVVFQKNPVVFFAKADTGIRTPKDFVGKTVGIKYGFDIEYFFPLLLKKAGVAGHVRTEAIKYDMSQFFSGAVDVWSGYAINEPIVAEEKNVPINIIQADPGLVQRFVNATLKGWQWAIDNRDQAAEITVQVDPHLDRDHQVRMLNAAAPMVKPNAESKIGAIDPAIWASMHQVLLDSGFLKAPVDVPAAYSRIFVERYYHAQP
jgi:NitT/TauT family transport system substrate-binding protein